MARVPIKASVPRGQVKVTVRVTFPDKSDSWSQQITLMDRAPVSAARQCEALVAAWGQALLGGTDWDAILAEEP
jgi:hypothetical protein